jgi:glycosyltransferase involved in cell wall biosynthesis
MAELLAERGEVVHVVAPVAGGEAPAPEGRFRGRLHVHRIPTPAWSGWKATRAVAPALTFAWRAGRLIERIVDEERIDVIESQEYAAPLYWFLRRRRRQASIGRRPPCIVHLHSPSELIARHNGDARSAHHEATARMEDFTIAEADALLAPDETLSAWAAGRDPRGRRASVIPYPGPAGPSSVRTRATWREGTVCYVGRLEVRKGVFDWIEAAVRVADDFPAQRFVLAGADTRDAGGSVRARLESRIPARMRERFAFAGEVPRDAVGRVFAQARIAAVPSRWDNYPNTCMEAMASGLPVIGTRTGGIPSMLTPGRNGWLAEAGSPESIEVALRAALGTSGERLASMGEAAAADIARIGDGDAVFAAHMAVRRALVG